MTLLLGGDLESKVSEAVKASEVAKKLSFNRTPHRHPNHHFGSPRGYYPYHNQNQHQTNTFRSQFPRGGGRTCGRGNFWYQRHFRSQSTWGRGNRGR